jgi:RNA polymerase sigma-70 factor (ECF subfamily)
MLRHPLATSVGPGAHAENPALSATLVASHHPDEPTDAELAVRAAAGDRAAAGGLIDRHQGAVRAFLRRLTGRPELADDLAQETFVRLLKHVGSYDPAHPMRRWLFTIARRLLINHSRKSDERVASTEYLGMSSESDNPTSTVARADDLRHARAALDRALAQLSPTQREVVVLYHQREMSVQDVAAAMEMPEGTVKSHLHRARAALRKLLEPHLEVLQP